MKENSPSDEMRDAFLTGAAARAEHYEIAAYTGLVNQARALGEREAVELLQENLKQEKEALKKVETISKRLLKESNGSNGSSTRSSSSSRSRATGGSSSNEASLGRGHGPAPVRTVRRQFPTRERLAGSASTRGSALYAMSAVRGRDADGLRRRAKGGLMLVGEQPGDTRIGPAIRSSGLPAACFASCSRK